MRRRALWALTRSDDAGAVAQAGAIARAVASDSHEADGLRAAALGALRELAPDEARALARAVRPSAGQLLSRKAAALAAP